MEGWVGGEGGELAALFEPEGEERGIDRGGGGGEAAGGKGWSDEAVELLEGEDGDPGGGEHGPGAAVGSVEFAVEDREEGEGRKTGGGTGRGEPGEEGGVLGVEGRAGGGVAGEEEFARGAWCVHGRAAATESPD